MRFLLPLICLWLIFLAITSCFFFFFLAQVPTDVEGNETFQRLFTGFSCLLSFFPHPLNSFANCLWSGCHNSTGISEVVSWMFQLLFLGFLKLFRLSCVLHNALDLIEHLIRRGSTFPCLWSNQVIKIGLTIRVISTHFTTWSSKMDFSEINVSQRYLFNIVDEKL